MADNSKRNLLVAGAQALHAGEREKARDLLLQYAEQNEDDPEGWLWLSGAVDDPNDVQTALENVISLDPGNVRAQAGLRWLQTHA